MFNVSNAHHFRKTVAGLCMMGAPAFLLASAIVSPDLKDDEAAQISVVANHMDRWYVTSMLALIAIVLAVPAVLGLMHMLRERRVEFGHLGGALALLGLLAATCAAAVSFVVWQMAAAGADHAQMAALLDRIHTTTGTFIPLYAGGFLFALGIATLAYGLYVARAVHLALAFAMAAGAALLVIGYAVSGMGLALIGAAFLLVGLGSIGRMVLAESDEEWEHTPEFKGFRPLAGSH